MPSAEQFSEARQEEPTLTAGSQKRKATKANEKQVAKKRKKTAEKKGKQKEESPLQANGTRKQRKTRKQKHDEDDNEKNDEERGKENESKAEPSSASSPSELVASSLIQTSTTAPEGAGLSTSGDSSQSKKLKPNSSWVRLHFGVLNILHLLIFLFNQKTRKRKTLLTRQFLERKKFILAELEREKILIYSKLHKLISTTPDSALAQWRRDKPLMT